MPVKNEIQRMVKFNKACSPYNAGEVARFGAAQAAKLTGGTNPIGFYTKKNDNGEWVRDTGAYTDEQNNEQAVEDGSTFEQKGTGPETGTGGQGNEDKPVTGADKKPAGRRARAKL